MVSLDFENLLKKLKQRRAYRSSELDPEDLDCLRGRERVRFRNGSITIPTITLPHAFSKTELHIVHVQWYTDVIGIDPRVAGALVMDEVVPEQILGKSVEQLRRLHNIGPYRAQNIVDATLSFRDRIAVDPEITPFPRYR